MNDQLSQSQLDAMGQMYNITPQQSKSGLGQTTNMLTQAIGGWQNLTKNISMGVAQSELGLGAGMAKLIGEGLSHVPGLQQTGQNIVAEQNKEQASPVLQPQNMAQQVGKTGADIGEFFVPGAGEDMAVAKGSSLIEKIPQIGKLATGALKTALKAGTSALSFGGVTAAQTGDINKAKGAAELGGTFGGLTGALNVISPGLLNALNKADFRLTPTMEAKTTKIADDAALFLTKNKITGTDSTKYRKLSSLTSQLESTLQKSLPTNIAVSKDSIADSIRTDVEQLRSTNEAVYNKARAKTDQALSLLSDREGNTMSVKDVLNSKRSWASEAFKTASQSKRDPTVSSVGDYIVEQAYQKAFTDAYARAGEEIPLPANLQKYFDGNESVTPDEFNKVYSSAINARNFTFAGQFKNDAGLVGRIFGIFAGETLGSSLGFGAAGRLPFAALGETISNEGPGMVRNVLERGLYHGNAPVTGARILQGTEDATQNPSNQ